MSDHYERVGRKKSQRKGCVARCRSQGCNLEARNGTYIKSRIPTIKVANLVKLVSGTAVLVVVGAEKERPLP